MEIAGKEITPEMIRALQHKYKGTDVELELCRLVLYLAKNPARARAMKKPLRFVENCLKKCRPHLVDVSKPSEIDETTNISERELLNAAAIKGLAPAPGESWTQFARRVRAG